MPRVERTVTWCDLCWAARERVEGTPVKVTIDRDRARTMIVCPQHRTELVAPLRTAIFKYGKPDKPPAKTKQRGRDKGPYQCKVAGCSWPPLKHRDSLGQHLKGQHGMALSDYIATYGELVELTPEEAAAIVVTVPCPDCPTVYSTADGYQWPHQALRNHRLAAHLTKD